MFGRYAGVVSKLREHEITIVSDSPLALIRSSQEAAIADSISANFRSLKSVSLAPEKRASTAVREGFRAGHKTEIRQGFETSKATTVIR